MKTLLAMITFCLVSMVIAPSRANAQCPINGNWGYVTSGFSIFNLQAGGAPRNPFGLFVFGASGKFTAQTCSIAAGSNLCTGQLSVVDTVSSDLAVNRNATSNPGRYSLDPVACTGQITFNSGILRITYDFTITQGGAKMLLIGDDQGSTITGYAERTGL